MRLRYTYLTHPPYEQAEMSTREPDAIPNHVTKQLGKVYVLAVVCGVTWST